MYYTGSAYCQARIEAIENNFDQAMAEFVNQATTREVSLTAHCFSQERVEAISMAMGVEAPDFKAWEGPAAKLKRFAIACSLAANRENGVFTKSEFWTAISAAGHYPEEGLDTEDWLDAWEFYNRVVSEWAQPRSWAVAEHRSLESQSLARMKDWAAMKVGERHGRP